MPKFSANSKRNLATVDNRLQALFNRVIEVMDCTVISGYRSTSEQSSLYAVGRVEGSGGHTITNCDGIIKKSKHQTGKAVDVMRYPIRWDDDQYNLEFALFVKGVAHGMGLDVKWGGSWKGFRDVPHWQVE